MAWGAHTALALSAAEAASCTTWLCPCVSAPCHSIFPLTFLTSGFRGLPVVVVPQVGQYDGLLKQFQATAIRTESLSAVLNMGQVRARGCACTCRKAAGCIFRSPRLIGAANHAVQS